MCWPCYDHHLTTSAVDKDDDVIELSDLGKAKEGEEEDEEDEEDDDEDDDETKEIDLSIDDAVRAYIGLHCNGRTTPSC